jgi:osmotically-inducible protein OsmY
MKNTPKWLTALGISVLLLGAGCATDDRASDDAAMSGADRTMTEPVGTLATPGPATAMSGDAERTAKVSAERIEDVLEEDANLKSFDLDVEEEENRIVLKGKVDTAAQKTMAEEIARQNAPGHHILSQIVVDP